MGDHHDLDLETLKIKLKYVNCIDDTIRRPHEIWLHLETDATYYFKKYVGNVTIIVRVKDHILQDFEVIEGDSPYIDKLRSGVLLYHQY